MADLVIPAPLYKGKSCHNNNPRTERLPWQTWSFQHHSTKGSHDIIALAQNASHGRLGAKTIKKNTNSTQNKSETHRAKQYEVTSFLSTYCELSTETCSKNVYSLGPWSFQHHSTKVSHDIIIALAQNASHGRPG